MVFDLNEGLRAMIEDGVRYRHPDYNQEQVRLAVVRMMLGERLFHHVYPGVEVKP